MVDDAEQGLFGWRPSCPNRRSCIDAHEARGALGFDFMKTSTGLRLRGGIGFSGVLALGAAYDAEVGFAAGLEWGCDAEVEAG